MYIRGSSNKNISKILILTNNRTYVFGLNILENIYESHKHFDVYTTLTGRYIVK